MTSTDGTVVLAAREVGKRFGETAALAGVSLEVRAGEVLGLVGANGAGKSTLTKILSGMEAPTSGHVEVRGRRVRLASAEQAREYADKGFDMISVALDATLLQASLAKTVGAAKGTGAEWAATLATTQANFVRSTSEVVLGAMRQQLRGGTGS